MRLSAPQRPTFADIFDERRQARKINPTGAHSVITRTALHSFRSPLMNAKRLTWALAALALAASPPAHAQTIDSIGITPPSPTAADAITVHASGIHDTLGDPLHAPLALFGNQVQLDVLFTQLGIAAPPILGPYNVQQNIGTLPVGPYSLRVRTFLGNPGEFEAPWTFPEVFPAVVGAGPRATSTTTFTVAPVPEPAAQRWPSSASAASARPLAALDCKCNSCKNLAQFFLVHIGPPIRNNQCTRNGRGPGQPIKP